MATEKRLIDADMLKANFPVLGQFAKDLWHAGTIRIAIDNAPTVDAVEVVHGRWIVGHAESIRCSECCFNRASIKIPMDYCPNCGTRMDLEV